MDYTQTIKLARLVRGGLLAGKDFHGQCRAYNLRFAQLCEVAKILILEDYGEDVAVYILL